LNHEIDVSHSLLLFLIYSFAMHVNRKPLLTPMADYGSWSYGGGTVATREGPMIQFGCTSFGEKL
jgi:hypothetical protein